MTQATPSTTTPGERALTRRLGELLQDRFVRALEQPHDQGPDLHGLPGWAIEVKTTVNPRVKSSWQHALKRARQHGGRPALFYRARPGQWRVILGLRALAPHLPDLPELLTVETDLDTFAAIVHRGNPDAERNRSG